MRTVHPEIEEDPPGQTKFHHTLLPDPARTVQINRLVAPKNHGKYRVEWSYLDDVDPYTVAADELEKGGRGKATGDGNFVRNLRIGDVVTLWAHARFPGWENKVKNVQMDVYWAI